MANRRARGERRRETFDFLGFTHYCRTTRKGRFGLGRRPTPDAVPDDVVGPYCCRTALARSSTPTRLTLGDRIGPSMMQATDEPTADGRKMHGSGPNAMPFPA